MGSSCAVSAMRQDVWYAYQGAQLAEPEFCCSTTVFVPTCVLTLPVGVVLPAKEKSITPMNSAIKAYINFASLNLFDGVCSSPGIFAQDSLQRDRIQIAVEDQRVQSICAVQSERAARKVSPAYPLRRGA